MIRLRSLAIAIASVALAAASGADAWVRINEKALPQTIALLPVSDGFALGGRGEIIIRQSLKPPASPGAEPVLAPTASQRREAAKLSLEGYRLEPFNHAAVRNLGLLADAQGDLPRARTFMRAASRITRRDLAATSWLATDYVRVGDVGKALASFDAALRTSGRAQELMLPRLLQFLQNDELVEPVLGLLDKNPPWQGAFWGAAPRYTASLENIARIRLALDENRSEVPREDDLNLISELASHRHFASGRRLVDLLSAQKGTRGEAIRNSSFDARTEFEPFDWSLFFDSSLTTDLNPDRGELVISTFSGSGGRVARQVVSLPGNSYTLSLRAQNWDRLDEGALYVRLECAEREGTQRHTDISVDRPALDVRFDKPESNCSYYWLTLFARSRDDRQDNVVILDSISLRRNYGDSNG